MGFGRRRDWKKSQDNRDNGYRKKRKLKTQIRLLGVIVVLIGFIVSLYDSKNNDLATHQQYFLISIGLIIIGMAMILQRKLLDGLKNMTKERCQCCKCTNCGSNHNHWTHD